MKKLSMILVALIAAGMMLTGCALFPAPVEAKPEPTAEATTAPEATAADDGTLAFSLTTLTGETLDQTVFMDNKLIMVNYWATWCGPCVGEIPDLIKISKEYADKDFVIVGVLTGDDDIDGAKQFIADQGMSYPVVTPEAFFLDNSSDIYAIPTTKFFDSTGKQVGESVVGAMSYDDWKGLIDLLLDQVS